MPRLNNSPMFRLVVAYILIAFGFTPVALYIIYPAWRWVLNWLINKTPFAPSSMMLQYFYAALSQYFAYGLLVAVFYLLVYRPLRLRPIFGARLGKLRNVLIIACIVCGYLAMSPISFLLSVQDDLTLLEFAITGLSEEWIYRGVMIRVLKDRFGIIWAILLSSILFGMSHWVAILTSSDLSLFSPTSLSQMAGDVIFGIIFGVIAWRSRSLIWVAFLHCMNDLHPFMTSPGRHWMLFGYVSSLGLIVPLYVMGLIGAEVIRASTKSSRADPLARTDVSF